MSLVPSLLNAILRLDGEALVMHVGEKPYVVAPSGQVELASRALTLDAVSGMVAQLLPAELQRALDEFGAVQYEFPSSTEFTGEHFTVVAARGGDDIWVEVRRRRLADDDRVTDEVWATKEEKSADDLTVPDASQLWAAPVEHEHPPAPPAVITSSVAAEPAPSPSARQSAGDQHMVRIEEPAPAKIVEPPPPKIETPLRFEEPAEEVEIDVVPPEAFDAADASEVERLTASVMEHYERSAIEPLSPGHQEIDSGRPIAEVEAPIPQASETAPQSAEPEDTGTFVGTTPSAVVEPEKEEPEPEPVPAPLSVITGFVRPSSASPAVVVPMSRNARPDASSPMSASSKAGLDRLLRLAAARGASTLYLTSQARPSIRVDGEIQPLSAEAPLTASDVEALLLDLMPERNREELRSGAGTEWICDVAEVGRVRCMTFRDHRGAGGIFRMMPVQAISADQLGLSREIQALAAEPEGLVLVAGPRSSGKSTLISAFVDLINRTRRDHVITIESEIKIVHEQRSSLVSQREVRGSNEQMLNVVRGAMRENPDVLVIEELRSAEIVSVALEASGSGHLVIGALPAHTATGAVDRIIDLYPPEQRRHVQLSMAENLRGIVAQVLLRRPGGGRIAAREVLLNTGAVASVIAEGKTSQLPLAIEGGRKYGMIPLNDALVGFVQSGAVDAREAYRRAADRVGFLALLKRQGIDTSFVERLA